MAFCGVSRGGNTLSFICSCLPHKIQSLLPQRKLQGKEESSLFFQKRVIEERRVPTFRGVRSSAYDKDIISNLIWEKKAGLVLIHCVLIIDDQLMPELYLSNQNLSPEYLLTCSTLKPSQGKKEKWTDHKVKPSGKKTLCTTVFSSVKL